MSECWLQMFKTQSFLLYYILFYCCDSVSQQTWLKQNEIKKIQKETRAAFNKLVKNTVEDLKIIYKHKRHYEELLNCQELIIAQVRKINVTQEEIIDLANEDRVEYETREVFKFEQFINEEIIILNKRN